MCRGNKLMETVRQRRLVPKPLATRRAGIMLALLAVFFPARATAQTTQKPGKYALTAHEQWLAEMVCLPQKYGPNGELLWTACVDDNIRCMLAAKKLRYLDGSWILTGELKAGPWGRPGKFTRTERNSWQEKDWSLVSHWTEDQPTGVVSGRTKIEYDGKSKGYVFHEAGPGGGKQVGTGTLDANTGTWTWLGHTRLANGKAVQSRWTVHPISAASYRFLLEIASPGSKWTTVLRGTGTKSR